MQSQKNLKPIDKKEIEGTATKRPTIFITPKDLEDTEKLKQTLNKEKYSEIIYVSPVAVKATQEHINAVINSDKHSINKLSKI